MQNDRLAVGDPKVDIIAAMDGKPQPGPYRISRHACVPGFGYAMKMVDDFRNEAPSSVDTIGRDKVKDLIEISVSRIG